MSEIFLGYLANSILRGGLLVLLLLLAELVLRRRLLFAGGRSLYLLAMVLILLPLEHVSGFRAASPLAESIEVPFENRFSPPTVPEGTSMNSGGAAANAVEKSDTAPRILPAETESPEVASSRPASWLMIFYLAGATLLTADQLRRLLLWRRRIRRCPAITGGEVFEQFLAAKRLAGVERFPIALRDCGGLLPVAACFGTLRHGTVLCPQEHYAALPEAALRMIFIHELEHLRRGDNPAGFLLTLLANLLFPNWFLRFLITRYAMVADALNLGGKTDDEKVDNLIKAVEDLKKKIGIKKTIKEYGVDEKYFLDNLDAMTEQAFDDQCTGANPRYPLMSELKEIYLKAYYGK